MLVAAGAVGVTGTFAWFQVGASIDEKNVDTANVTAISGQTGSEEFDITVVAGTITNYNAVYLTNDSGQTKIISGGQNAVITPTGGAAYATVGAATLKVEYKGASATTAAGVLSFWKSALTTSIWVKATDTTAYNAGAGFAAVAGDNNDMIEVAAANKGLKFWTTAPSSASDWVLSTHKSATVSVTESTAENVAFSLVSTVWTATIDIPDILVGIQGVDNIVQDADDTYEMTLTPSLTDPDA